MNKWEHHRENWLLSLVSGLYLNSIRHQLEHQHQHTHNSTQGRNFTTILPESWSKMWYPFWGVKPALASSSVNGSPCNHKLHYNLMLQPGVCGANDVKLFDNEVKGQCCTKTELSHFGQHGPISVLMFYSPCSHFPPFKRHSGQTVYLQFHFAKCLVLLIRFTL